MDAERRIRILMVEDDQDLCSGWEDLFDLLGYAVSCFHRALDLLDDGTALSECDLLISDYYLPDLNGVELIRRCRARRPGLPAILLTGSKEDIVMNAAQHVDGCHVLHKPVNIEDLDGHIRRLAGTDQTVPAWQ